MRNEASMKQSNVVAQDSLWFWEKRLQLPESALVIVSPGQCSHLSKCLISQENRKAINPHQIMFVHSELDKDIILIVDNIRVCGVYRARQPQIAACGTLVASKDDASSNWI
jgi:hypothetical protein